MTTDELIKEIEGDADIRHFLERFRKEAPLDEKRAEEIFKNVFWFLELENVDFDEIANFVNALLSKS